MPEEINTDVLIIGCGVAGCAAALAAARAGLRVLVLTGSDKAVECNSAYAQGGIVARGPGDTSQLLEQDIHRAGAQMCEPRAVARLAEEAPGLLERLLIDELQVPFDRDPEGQLHWTEEAAHSVPRILHVEDLTGRAIIENMLEALAAEERIELRTGMTAVDLLSLPVHSQNHLDIYKPERCLGAYVLEQATGEVLTVTARQTLLATGGLGQIYLHTTNPSRARGDGIAMAYRFGARLLNLEFIQFHPTALYHRDANRFLISESLRGEGAVLVDRQGRPFMERYHELGSLAPRDVVARAIHNEMLESGRSCMYLDITHKSADWVRHRFPHIYQTCMDYGIDITARPVPVVPAAHYSCGGVFVNALGRTNMPGLRAVGEVACTGLHGANRLASTSLLEGLFWGWNTGEDTARAVRRSYDEGVVFPPIRPFVRETDPVDPALIQQDWLTVKYTMWNYVGLTRTRRRMRRALEILRELQNEVLAFYQKAEPTDAVIGLRNAVTTALAVVHAAARNPRSVGCHYLEEE